MSLEEVLKFVEIHNEKRKFHTSEPIAHIWNIVTSHKYSLKKKCLKNFISYMDHFDIYHVKPLLIRLRKLKRSIKSFKKVKYMSFMFEEKCKAMYWVNVPMYGIKLKIIFLLMLKQLCVHFTSFIISPKWGRTRASSSECKLTNLILHTGCPSYHLTTWRKSALIQ